MTSESEDKHVQELEYICADCVSNSRLCKLLVEEDISHDCVFCGRSALSMPVTYLARELRLIILERYTLAGFGEGDLFAGATQAPLPAAAMPIGTLIESLVGVSEPIGRVIRGKMTIRDLDFDRVEDPDYWFWFGIGLDHEESFIGYVDEPTQGRMRQELLNVGASLIGLDSADALLSLYFAPDAQFAGPFIPREVPQYWDEFEKEVTLRARFFSKRAASHLSALAGVMAKCSATSREKVFRYIDGRRKLYRARLFPTREEAERALVEPEIGLAPPPSRLAKAGRMNPEGISVFYGATSVDTAVAEVRPAVGTTVVVGGFRALRPLLVLDVDELREASFELDPLDASWEHTSRGINILRGLSDRISRAVLPLDESRDYIPTQVFAEFLSNYRPITYRQTLDGIVFKSAQGGRGKNIVLFREASRVLGQDYGVSEENIEPSLWLNRTEIQEFAITSASYSWTVSSGVTRSGGPMRPSYPQGQPSRRLAESELEYDTKSHDVPF